MRLHRLLIEPIEDLLPTDPNDKVIFIPQGPLFLVPFPALQRSDGRYLVEQHTLSTAPSIQVLMLTGRHQDSMPEAALREVEPEQLGPGLVVGNPTMPHLPEWPEPLPALPGAEVEAELIAALLDTNPVTGDQATKAYVLGRLGDAPLIHLATHGILDDDRGLGSAVALAPTASDAGLLTAEEILDMDLKAELVVLSACNTGRGRITGDGVIGLSRSFLSAGVPSVIVSLWSVPDAPTARLMSEFYKNLKAKPDKAGALRQAMLTTMRLYPDPLSWAGFTLIGEPESARH